MRWRPLVVGVLVSWVCFVGFWELAEDYAYSPAIIAFDEKVTVAIQSFRAPLLTVLMKGVTALGGTIVVTAATLALFVALWLRHRRADAVLTALAVGGGIVLSTVAKGHLGRERPPTDIALVPIPSTMSLPSGHSMGSLCLGYAISYVTLRSDMDRAAKYAVIAACVLYAALVGVSRVYLGVHWPSDVLASWCLGGAWLALLTGVVEALR